MKKFFFLFAILISIAYGQNDWDGIIISQYVEGTSNDKAIEIFNGRRDHQALPLSRIRLRLYTNGASNPNNTITFSTADDNSTNSIPYLGAFVVYHTSYASVDINMPNCPTSKRKSNGSIQHSGNDAYDLQYDTDGKGNWVTVDIFGKIGQDPGTAWTGGGLSTKDYSLVRKSNINIGITTNPTSFDPSVEYEGTSFGKSGPLSTLGQHTMDNPLPVELSLLTYKLVDGKVKLLWNTATELNNKGFYVEKNTGNNWVTLGFVDGKGNSNVANSYEFTDNSQNFGKVTYRLKQVDFDGKFTYSNTIEVNVGLPKELTLMQNYPNPFNPATTISYAIPTAGNVSVKVYNSLGQEVATLFEGYQEAGMKQLNFNANNLNSGIYYCVVNFGNSTKVTKMMLMK